MDHISTTNINLDSINNLTPNYNSIAVVIHIYDITGNLKLKIISPHAQYFSNQKIIWFLQPEFFVLNKNNCTVWNISCAQAILYCKNTLVLSGYVCINKILNNKIFESIITHQTLINLIDYNITAKTKTIIHGYHFYSIGSQMYFDFKTENITLFDEIYTQYEI